MAGPWSVTLLEKSNIYCPLKLNLVRGSHLILKQSTSQAYLLEVPNDRRIFFVLPWQGKTLVGTTEIRQKIDFPIQCSLEEEDYLLKAYKRYFPHIGPEILERFSGLRPLLYNAAEPTKNTREYAIYQTGKLISALGGKWTTAVALAVKISKIINKTQSSRFKLT